MSSADSEKQNSALATVLQGSSARYVEAGNLTVSRLLASVRDLKDRRSVALDLRISGIADERSRHTEHNTTFQAGSPTA